jgi:hypothetical protein
VRLIDVEQQLIEVIDQIMEAQAAGIEPSPEALQIAEDYTVSSVEKRDAFARALQFVSDREESYSREITALGEKRRAVAAARERMEKYLLLAMQVNGIRIACGGFYKFVVTDSQSVVGTGPNEAIDVSKLTDEYVRTKIVVEPDKKSIRLALESGWKSDAVRLKTTSHVNISKLAVKDRAGDMVRA